MKRNIPGFLEAAALSMLSAWGAVGCLLSAFCLPVAYPNQVMLVWLCWTLLCAGALLYRWGEVVVLALGAAGAFWLWWEGSFGPQLLSVLGTLAKAYDGGYGTGVPQILRVDRQPADLPLTVLGMLLIFAVCRTVCRRKGNLLPVGLLLLPLAACLVVTDTVPDEGYLFALLFSLCLLLLTEGVRRESGSQAARLCAIAVFPVALALGLLLVTLAVLWTDQVPRLWMRLALGAGLALTLLLAPAVSRGNRRRQTLVLGCGVFACLLLSMVLGWTVSPIRLDTGTQGAS